MSIFDLYNSGYKNILLSFQVYGENLKLINTRPFNDAEIDSVRSNCVMDNNPQKVVRLHIKIGGYIYFTAFNEQDELVRGDKIDLKSVELVKLRHSNIGFDSKDDETIGIYIPINNKEIQIGAKIRRYGKDWEVYKKRPFNNFELDFVQSALVTTDKPDKYVLFFMKDGKQHKIPLSRQGVDCPIGSSIDLQNASLVTFYREGYGNELFVEVNSKKIEKNDENEDKSKIATKEKKEVEEGNNKRTVRNYKKLINILGKVVWFILGILFWGFVIYSIL